uniref:ATP-dependent DNA ligase family profile domain-containing protein n=1 Tax=viral metagenome TaxID=1070528 RepID=A0A6C0BN87_9ZZZZ
MEDFPVLYTLSKRGLIRQWQVWVEIMEEGNVYILKRYGQKDGKLIQTRKKVSRAKSQGTILEQAKRDAAKMWQDQVNKQGYTEAIPEQKQKESVAFYPMLAHKWPAKCKYVKFPCFSQPKLDGVRACAHCVPGALVELKSRNNKIFPQFLSIIEAIQDLKIQEPLILDGELYSREMPFRTLNGICNRKKRPYRAPNIQYHIFDVYFPGQPQTSFQARYKFLQALVPANHLLLCLVNCQRVDQAPTIKRQHDEHVQAGYEGIMLRNIASPYMVKHRSTDLLKFKMFSDEEFKIAGATEGEGKEEGCLIWTLQTPTGEIFQCRPRGSHAERQAAWEAYQKDPSNFQGQLYTVRYQEKYANGKPRFPVGIGIRHE